MADYKVSTSVLNSLENLISNACSDNVLHLSVLDDTDPYKAEEEIEVMVQVIKPFNNPNLRNIAIIYVNYDIESVELYGMNLNDDVYAIVSNITKRAFAYSSNGHDKDILVTFRPECGSKRFKEYVNLVKERAVDLGKTDKEIYDLTEGLLMFAGDHYLNDIEIERFMCDTEDDCLVWDALNGTYTSDLEKYVYEVVKVSNPVFDKKEETPAVQTETPDENDTIFMVRQVSTHDYNTLTTSEVHFTDRETAEVFLASVRDTLIADGSDAYPKEVVESEGRHIGILIDNDSEFYITDGAVRSDHLTISELPVFNRVETL